MIQRFPVRSGIGLVAMAIGSAALAAGFNSGSTGADGDFNPTTDTVLTMPANGVFNFGNVNIPASVKVTFVKNAANTPVLLLATGTVTIGGTLDVNGGNSLATGTGAIGDLGAGGKGGPGGFDGGRGGQAAAERTGAQGMGPGGGMGGAVTSACSSQPQGGGGGSFGGKGSGSQCVTSPWGCGGNGSATSCTGLTGATYGSASVLPLVGGSGGGGGAGSSAVTTGYPGTGGGGGGGALLIAASGGVTLSGVISARGGTPGKSNDCSGTNTVTGGAGGGGSGGAVRVLAPSFTGNGKIDVAGGIGTDVCGDSWTDGGSGGLGRVSIETATGGTLRLTGLPSLAISTIGNVPVPAQPVGFGDVSLPVDLANPVTVTLTASAIPVGTVANVTLYPPYGPATTVASTPLAGTYASSTATTSVNIPQGASVIMASTTYTLTVAQGEALSVYAAGERVEKVALSAEPGQATKATLVTVSGKRYEVPTAVLAVAMG